jgi:hypothetical protein
MNLPVKTFTAASIFFIVAGCNQKQQQVDAAAGIITTPAVVIDTTFSSCPHLSKDNDGHIVLSWIRSLNDSSSLICFAFSPDGGKTFGKAITIPASNNVNPHAENMPKFIYKPSGEVIAAWGASNPNPKNPYAGLVYYSQSFDNGTTWGKAIPLVKDPQSFDQRYFDLAILPTGEAAIIWLDNRKKSVKEGSAIYFASTTGKEGFKHEELIGESCCECCRTNLFVDSKHNIHVAYRGIINDSIRDMVHAVSTDGGNSFSRARRLSNDNWVISGCPHTGPAMVENKTGLHFAWYTMGSGSGLYFCSSADNGKSFSARDSIRNKPAARHPQLVSFKNGEMLVAWDETMNFDNTPSTRIGIQKRSPEGERLFTQYITPDTIKSTYPVLQVIDEHRSIIAYDENIKDRSRVVYRLLTF